MTWLVQVFCVNALCNGCDVAAIIPTGSGKTLVIYLFALTLQKLNPGTKAMIIVGKLTGTQGSLLFPKIEFIIKADMRGWNFL